MRKSLDGASRHSRTLRPITPREVDFGTDGEITSVTWKTMRVHFRYTESSTWIAPYIKPQIPMVCDPVSDPHETIDLMQADLTAGWVIGAALGPARGLQ
jgi:hypothetical protein